jgi:hypothetical protein
MLAAAQQQCKEEEEKRQILEEELSVLCAFVTPFVFTGCNFCAQSTRTMLKESLAAQKSLHLGHARLQLETVQVPH